MKRIIVILLSLFYLVFASGMHLEIDKCCQKLAAVWIVDFGADNCAKESLKSGCCSHSTPCEENEIPGHKSCDTIDIILSIQDSHRAPVQISIDDYVPVCGIVKVNKIRPVFKESNNIILIPKDHHPPDSLPFYILNSSLTYYG